MLSGSVFFVLRLNLQQLLPGGEEELAGFGVPALPDFDGELDDLLLRFLEAKDLREHLLGVPDVLDHSRGLLCRPRGLAVTPKESEAGPAWKRGA